ncbi:MAG: endonuclease domain-containing protein [Candidatus Melainabacteria bacterium]
MKDVARILRRDQTKTEALLWRELRNQQLGGYRFRRQQPIERYIVDFFCPAKKLVIEIDGGIHLEAEQRGNDIARQDFLKALGLTVIRFTTAEVLHHRDSVLMRIRETLDRL